MKPIELTINGQPRTVSVEPGMSLLFLLRERLGLTGAKPGCGEGQCGACTVLLAGQPVRACVTPAAAAQGASVTTIEGLASGDTLHPVQEAFLAVAAFQCGYCTPGMILGVVALLNKTPDPTPGEVAQALEGHICRCGTYPRIVQAVRLAVKGARRGG